MKAFHRLNRQADSGASAILAIDGVNSEIGPTGAPSVSRTLVERGPWWQVIGPLTLLPNFCIKRLQMDLGGSNFVSNLTIWNVQGVEGSRLRNFYVLLSEQPFLTTQLQDLLKDPAVWKFHVPYSVTDQSFVFPLQTARFIRIQLV